MPKIQKVGTGITRHERIIWNMFDPTDREDADNEIGGHIWPQDNFPGWLDQREARLAEALEYFRLPAPNRLVVYDKATPRNWRYEDDLNAPGTHARTEWYLQAFPYQSSFWFIGRILFFITQCRFALKKGQPERAAGYALQLGTVDGWFKLKFSAEKRLQDFERHVAASNAGNRTKQAKAAEWKGEARSIIASHPAIDLDNAASAARTILAAWPEDIRRPSQRSLRAYIPSMAKRAVLPEMKSGT